MNALNVTSDFQIYLQQAITERYLQCDSTGNMLDNVDLSDAERDSVAYIAGAVLKIIGDKLWELKRNIKSNGHKKITMVDKILWPTRDTLSPCKSIAAPWKLTCSMHFRLFSVQIYRCSVQNLLLHTNIQSFSVQKLSFSVENSMLLRTNRMLLHGKFDISLHKSKANESFSVKLHSELGDLGSPLANKSLKLCFGEGMLCCL